MLYPTLYPPPLSWVADAPCTLARILVRIDTGAPLDVTAMTAPLSTPIEISTTYEGKDVQLLDPPVLSLREWLAHGDLRAVEGPEDSEPPHMMEIGINMAWLGLLGGGLPLDKGSTITITGDITHHTFVLQGFNR
ncbi:MAG: hypothetical protein GY937_01345 [bacterium]|nr:hypothetical protein [bacterium]